MIEEAVGRYICFSWATAESRTRRARDHAVVAVAMLAGGAHAECMATAKCSGAAASHSSQVKLCDQNLPDGSSSTPTNGLAGTTGLLGS
jgi:hypothetical protein